MISTSSFSISKILSHFRKTQNKFMTRPSMMLFLLAMLEHDITFFVWQNNDRYGLWDGLAIGHPQYINLSPSFRPTLVTISIVFERIYKILLALAKIAHPQFQSRDLKILSWSSCGEYSWATSISKMPYLVRPFLILILHCQQIVSVSQCLWLNIKEKMAV